MKCTNCRICKSIELNDVISLGNQKITSRFPVYGDFSTPTVDITLCLCKECGLLQLRDTTHCSEMYEREYGYKSGISNTMRKHLLEYSHEILSKVKVNVGDVIMDIGSNDSTMLSYYDTSFRRIGIDPTGCQFYNDYAKNQVELLPTYFTKRNITKEYGDIKCKIISSISMFYDLPDPVQFAKDIHDLLDKDGIWTCEQSYMPRMLETNSLDTICHEHLEYYSLFQIKKIADIANFKIIDVKFNECNGGSFRVYFAKNESLIHKECVKLLWNILKSEDALQLKNPQTFERFMKGCDTEFDKLKSFLKVANTNNQKVFVYGASTKGNCLLQYCNIGEEDIAFAVERNLEKVGKMTSTGIPIISEKVMRSVPPEYLLVLPWHFRNEILEREKEYMLNGGKIIFPLPKFQVVSYLDAHL